MNQSEGKILGVIGGMGPLATELFYKMVIDNTEATKDQDHLNMIILNHVTMPDRTEAIKSGNINKVSQKLREDIKFLEKAGVNSIAVPCNTSHVMLKNIEKEFNVTIINMVKEAATYVHNQFRGDCIRVGIMATDGTVETGLYNKECEELGLVPIVPDEKHQKKVMKIIYEGIKAGKQVDKEDFLAVEKYFKEMKCQCVILACTELSCYSQMENLSEYYVDAMKILAQKSIVINDKELKK